MEKKELKAKLVGIDFRKTFPEEEKSLVDWFLTKLDNSEEKELENGGQEKSSSDN